MAQQAIITLYPTLGGQPKTVLARDATPKQLYDALDAWRVHQIRNREDYKAVQMAKAEIGRIKREIKRRRLPMDRLLWREKQEN